MRSLSKRIPPFFLSPTDTCFLEMVPLPAPIGASTRRPFASRFAFYDENFSLS